MKQGGNVNINKAETNKFRLYLCCSFMLQDVAYYTIRFLQLHQSVVSTD